jgi:outer membrane protein insertion porin family
LLGRRSTRRHAAERLLVALLALGPATIGLAQSARVYVRRIEFVGVSHVNDEVLRRELLQLEGTYLNTVALDRSLARLERLPYVASAAASLHPVDGNLELVDIEIEIVEAAARRYGVGGAYSGALRARLHGYYVDENVAGTGQRLELRAEGNDLFFFGEVAHTDPYARLAGVSRTVALAARRIDRLSVDSSSVDTELRSARLEYAYRTAPAADELARDPAARPFEPAPRRGTWLAFGVEVRDVKMAASAAASEQLRRWIAAADGAGAAGAPLGVSYGTADFLMRWADDTRAPGAFPTTGRELTLGLRATLPGSDVDYYRIDYGATHYWPLGERWTTTLAVRLGTGGAYGGEWPSLPPYMNWLAGGPGTVRGYRDGTLGPRDSAGRPYGGDLLVAAQVEWLTPWPRRWQERVRTGFFYDVGNVFSAGDTVFSDGGGATVDYGFDAAELRQSAGVVAHVRIPLGVLSVSYARPLDARERAASAFGRDEVERLQLTIGVDF